MEPNIFRLGVSVTSFGIWSRTDIEPRVKVPHVKVMVQILAQVLQDDADGWQEDHDHDYDLYLSHDLYLGIDHDPYLILKQPNGRKNETSPWL